MYPPMGMPYQPPYQPAYNPYMPPGMGYQPYRDADGLSGHVSADGGLRGTRARLRPAAATTATGRGTRADSKRRAGFDAVRSLAGSENDGCEGAEPKPVPAPAPEPEKARRGFRRSEQSVPFGEQKPAVNPEAKPSENAADILKKYTQRRPV